MYNGGFDSGAPSRKGVMIYGDGGSYDGELLELRRHGWGVMQTADGRRHEGEWHDDMRSGYGREVLENGDAYEGQFADDARHGQGRWVASTGDSYEGGWARGKRSGQGVCKTLMPDELEKERQRVSAELLVHREKHLMKIGRRPRGTAELTDVRGVSFS